MSDINEENGSDTKAMAWDAPERPHGLQVGVGAVGFAIAFVIGALLIRLIPAEQAAARGVYEYGMSAAIGLIGFAAAFYAGSHNLAAFGFRAISWKWVVLSILVGIVIWVANNSALVAYINLTADNFNPQGDYHAAYKGGALMLAGSLLLGAIATPLGEEALFRGVLANALNRYGAWAGIGLSTVIFAIAHGFNLILLGALIVGGACATLFRVSRSIWPGVIVHGINNGLSALLVAYVSG